MQAFPQRVTLVKLVCREPGVPDEGGLLTLLKQVYWEQVTCSRLLGLTDGSTDGSTDSLTDWEGFLPFQYLLIHMLVRSSRQLGVPDEAELMPSPNPPHYMHMYCSILLCFLD
jgi:hypothetical protein